MSELNHPILTQSFAQIDREVGEHSLSEAEYAIARRVIHSTADFDFLHLLQFSPGAIASGIHALQQGVPIVVDVSMVERGIAGMVAKTTQNPVTIAVDRAPGAEEGKTRTETGLLRCFEEYPQALYAIGNAPTALLALCDRLAHSPLQPPLVIGAPVGFIAVLEAKEALKQTPVPQIRVAGRKGGSPVAAAILNALLLLATEEKPVYRPSLK